MQKKLFAIKYKTNSGTWWYVIEADNETTAEADFRQRFHDFHGSDQMYSEFGMVLQLEILIIKPWVL